MIDSLSTEDRVRCCFGYFCLILSFFIPPYASECAPTRSRGINSLGRDKKGDFPLKMVQNFCFSYITLRKDGSAPLGCT